MKRREQRQKAAKAAEDARRRADELADVAEFARQKRDKARAFDKKFDDLNEKFKQERKQLEDEASSLEEQAADPDADELEEGQTLEEAAETFAARAREKRDKLASEYNDETRDLRQRLRDERHAEYKALRVEHQRARADAEAASDLADTAEEEAAAADEALADVYRWIAWDGIYAAAGTCNSEYAETVASKAQARRRKRSKTKVLKVQAARLTSEQLHKLSARLDASAVSLSLVTCDAEFVPIEGRLLARLHLERIDLMRSMLVRVHDAADDVVYQEILDAKAIDRLPRAQGLAGRHRATLAQRVDACRDHAGAGDGRSPFRISVWVSQTDGAFDDIELTKAPKVKKGKQVHDRSSDGRYRTKPGVGVNQADARPMHLVTVALFEAQTSHSSPRHDREIDDKVDEVYDAVKRANAKLGALRPRELRVLLGPEWNFQARDCPWTYTADKKDDVVEAIRAMSARTRCKQWLILPGTILWGTRDPGSGCVPVLNTMVAACEGAIVHTYHKKQWGSDTPVPQFVFDECLLETEADGWERRHNKLNGQGLPKSLRQSMSARGWGVDDGARTIDVMTKDVRWRINYTPRASTDERTFVVYKPAHRKLNITPGELFAMALPAAEWPNYFGALTRNQFEAHNCFNHAGLELGIDICADHKGAQCAMSFKAHNRPGRGAGKDKGLDLYLFSSNTVDADFWKVAARTGGYMLHSDGAGYGVSARKIVARERGVREVGQIFIDARAACDPAQRGTDYVRPDDPGLGAPQPTVGVENLAGEKVAGKDGYSLVLHRLILVDP